MIIETKRLMYAFFYASAAGTEKVEYGCTVPFGVIPAELSEYVDRRPPRPEQLERFPGIENGTVRIKTSFAPTVVTKDNRQDMNALVQIFQFADAANIKRDWLFQDIPAKLAVELVEINTPPSRITPPSMRKVVRLVAVQVDFTDILAQYDRLCARHFCDPSYPRRDTDGR